MVHKRVLAMLTTQRVIRAGESGKKYEFECYSIDSQFPVLPAIAGVYIFTRGSWDIVWHTLSWEIIYVGQTGDLNARLDDSHQAWKCIKLHRATHVFILTDGMEKEEDRRAVEADLLAIGPTLCNKQGPGQSASTS